MLWNNDVLNSKQAFSKLARNMFLLFFSFALFYFLKRKRSRKGIRTERDKHDGAEAPACPPETPPLYPLHYIVSFHTFYRLVDIMIDTSCYRMSSLIASDGLDVIQVWMHLLKPRDKNATNLRLKSCIFLKT